MLFGIVTPIVMSVDMPAALSGLLFEAAPRRIGTPLIIMVGAALAAQQIIHGFVQQAAYARANSAP